MEIPTLFFSASAGHEELICEFPFSTTTATSITSITSITTKAKNSTSHIMNIRGILHVLVFCTAAMVTAQQQTRPTTTTTTVARQVAGQAVPRLPRGQAPRRSPTMPAEQVVSVPRAPATAPAIRTNATEQVVSPAQGGQPVAMPSEQDLCGPRIRKPWDRLTPLEKSVYIRALARVMDEGLYIKFVEIHTDQMTTAEAHRTCMFLYWHRKLLLGFENLLRSFGGEFACLTVPYWDYVTHNSRFMAGQCNSLEDCSPILQELGGSTMGRRARVTVNGTPITGTCVAVEPVNHFCEASHLSGAECVGCVPRGDWTRASFPATTTVSSLMRQLFSEPTIDGVSTNLEQGIHNTIHNSLGGAMGVLEAPADPIFFSHHATIDLLHSIFYHCAVGNTDAMPLDLKLADPRQFVGCERQEPLPVPAIDRDALLPQSHITLLSGEQGRVPNSVSDPTNALFPYFAPLPTEYMSYSDIRDLGAFSYNYEMAGELATMFTTCADISALTGVGGRGSFAGPGGFAGAAGGFAGAGVFRRLEQQASASFLEAVIVPPSDKQEAGNSSDAWYPAALRAALNVTTALAATNRSVSATALALREVEKMTCMFYDECRGHVTDFSAAFRSSFHTNANTTTPCFGIVRDVKNGRDAMLVTNWKDILLQFFSC